MAAEGKAIIFYRLFFISSAQMKGQQRDLNQTWPVGRKRCRFTNAAKHFGALPQIWGSKKHIFDHFYRDLSTRDHISPN